MKDLRNHLILTFPLVICLLVGCVHGPAPYRPNHWEGAPIGLNSVADDQGSPLLQVIIVYGHWWSHHTALRLVCPDRPVLFWDPAGSYGTHLPENVRSKDLIRINPPDLKTYLQFIWNTSSLEVEIFEWDLNPDDARDLYDVLDRGTDRTHPAGRFKTATMAPFCSTAVSDFLHRFAGKTLTVPESFFLPENLSRVLYTQSPKRVLSFRRGKQVVFVPPPISTEPIKRPPSPREN